MFLSTFRSLSWSKFLFVVLFGPFFLANVMWFQLCEGRLRVGIDEGDQADIKNHGRGILGEEQIKEQHPGVPAGMGLLGEEFVRRRNVQRETLKTLSTPNKRAKKLFLANLNVERWSKQREEMEKRGEDMRKGMFFFFFFLFLLLY